ncbi:MAG: F0F1 ATP synthase subunit epsilon [Rickettsiales bacterium]|jgi:F-type H+-transporting ATPase subunit epsilon|nr:F0F1 ATP synthase subunit epsilon [Rickettsiales bacterium]
MKDDFLLEIYTPTEVIINESIKSISLTAKEGQIKILPNHADYVTVFSSNIVDYTDINGNDKIIAVNDGILVKYGGTVCISTYSVVIGDTLEDIRQKIKDNAKAEQEKMKEINKIMKELDFYLLNNLKDLDI